MIADPNAIQAQPLPSGMPPGIVGSDEILGHVDRAFQSLPPVAQAAVSHAHGILGLEPTANAVANAPESPATPSIASSPSIPPATPPVAPGGDSAVPGMVGVNAGMLAAPPMPSSSVQALPNPPTQSSVSGNGEIADMDRANPNPAPAALPAGNRSSASTELQRMRDTGSGVSQIHDPFLKTLGTIGDVIGSGLFPGLTQFIPGSSAHHQMLVGNKEAEVTDEQGQQKAADESATAKANAEHITAEAQALPQKTEAESEHLGAQTNLANTQAENLKEEGKHTAASDYIKVGTDGLFNARTREWETLPKDKSDLYELSDENGKALDIKPDAKGQYWIPKSAAGSLLKPPSEKAPDDKEKFVKAYLSEHALEDNSTNRAKAIQAHAVASQAPQRPPQVTVMIPNAQGGYTAQSVHPGQDVAPGAVTVGGMNTANTPTMQQRNVAGQAALVHEQIPSVIADIDRMKDKLGPMAGRWNDFMQGKVGMDDPDFAALRADLLMASSAVALMHARGRLPENLRHEFDQAINAPKQSPENLKAILRKVDEWTVKTIDQGKPGHAGGSGPGDSASHKVGDIKTFPNGKKGKWDGQGWEPQ